MMRRMLLLFVVACCVPTARAAGPATGPWDLARLRQPPKVAWEDTDGTLRKLSYESEPLNGKPTRVFAYYAQPARVEGRLPAMVLVHGGGGTAFAEWAQLWANRGYAALAMDLAGCGPDRQRLPDGGPGQDDKSKFPRSRTDPREVWTYHAVAAVLRGVSLLRSLPQVDPERIGVTGISWGGYLTCIVAGLDDRLKVAVPVYGCGFLHENSAWLKILGQLPEPWRKEWIATFDPSRYVGQANMPVLFVNGTNDFAYPLDSYQKTYRLVKDRNLAITVGLKHSHPAGWAPVEIGLFVDQYLNGGKPLPRFTTVQRSGAAVEARFNTTVPVTKAELHWTTDEGRWQERKWQSKPATVAGDTVRVEVPTDRPLVYFLTLTDSRGATVSTEHEVLTK